MRKLNANWGIVSNEENGEFTPGTFFKKPRVKIQYRNYEIEMFPFYDSDRSEEKVTVLRAKVEPKDGLKVDIIQRKPLRMIFEMIKSVSAQKLTSMDTGCVEFDNMFITKTNNREKTLRLLSNDDIKKHMFFAEAIELHIGKGKKKEMHSFFVSIVAQGYVNEIVFLKKIIDLMKVIIDELILMESIEGLTGRISYNRNNYKRLKK